MENQNTNTTMNADVTRKIRALFALADKTNHPAEAASAIAKAQSLMTRHAISTNMLDYADEEKNRVFESPLNESEDGEDAPRKIVMWKVRLASTLAAANGCALYLNGPRIKVCGKPSNCDKLRYLFAYCAKQIDHLAKVSCKGEGRTYANNFRLGCVDAISEAIKAEKGALFAEMRAQATASANSERGLILLNNAIAKTEQEAAQASITMRQSVRLGGGRAASHSRYDSNARAHGKTAGSSIYPSGGRATIGSGSKRLN